MFGQCPNKYVFSLPWVFVKTCYRAILFGFSLLNFVLCRLSLSKTQLFDTSWNSWSRRLLQVSHDIEKRATHPVWKFIFSFFCSHLCPNRQIRAYLCNVTSSSGPALHLPLRPFVWFNPERRTMLTKGNSNRMLMSSAREVGICRLDPLIQGNAELKVCCKLCWVTTQGTDSKVWEKLNKDILFLLSYGPPLQNWLSLSFEDIWRATPQPQLQVILSFTRHNPLNRFFWFFWRHSSNSWLSRMFCCKL